MILSLAAVGANVQETEDDWLPENPNRCDYLTAAIEAIKAACEANALYAQADAIAAELAPTATQARAEAADVMNNVEWFREILPRLETWVPSHEKDAEVAANKGLGNLYLSMLKQCIEHSQATSEYAELAAIEAKLSSIERAEKVQKDKQAGVLDFREHNRLVDHGNELWDEGIKWGNRRDQLNSILQELPPTGALVNNGTRQRDVVVASRLQTRLQLFWCNFPYFEQ